MQLNCSQLLEQQLQPAVALKTMAMVGFPLCITHNKSPLHTHDHWEGLILTCSHELADCCKCWKTTVGTGSSVSEKSWQVNPCQALSMVSQRKLTLKNIHFSYKPVILKQRDPVQFCCIQHSIPCPHVLK